MLFLNNLKFLLPEIFLSSLILILLVYGVLFSRIQFFKKYFGGLNNIFFLIIFGLSLLLILQVYNYNCDFTILNFHFIGNRFVHFFKSILILVTLCLFIFSKNFIDYEKEFHFEYLILILLALLGLLLMVSANDFIFLYLALELQSLSLYVLAASNRYNNKSIEGGLKYFIFGSLASGLFLFGVSLLYGLTGCTNFNEIFIFLADSNNLGLFNHDYLGLLFLSFLFILSGFFFKFSIVPFHNWTPDVYEGSPYLITAFFALVPKLGIFAVLFNLYIMFILNYHSVFFNVLLFCSVSSIIIGSLAALYQTNLKRLFAYSTISNMGFILLGLSLNTFEGFHASLIYLLIYLLLMVCLFGAILQCRNVFNKNLITDMSDLSSLFRTFPILSIIIAITLFSLAGIPPLAGFFSKFYLVFALLKSKMFFTAFFVVFVGVYSCIYYIRLIKIMYFEKPFVWTFFYTINFELSYYILIFITFINITFFYFLDFLMDITRNILLRIFL